MSLKNPVLVSRRRRLILDAWTQETYTGILTPGDFASAVFGYQPTFATGTLVPTDFAGVTIAALYTTTADDLFIELSASAEHIATGSQILITLDGLYETVITMTDPDSGNIKSETSGISDYIRANTGIGLDVHMETIKP